jgi:hypothetical protein
MRWFNYDKSKSRTVRIFLIFPRTINNETRWLEWANIEQTYYEDWDLFGMWEDRKFIN